MAQKVADVELLIKISEALYENVLNGTYCGNLYEELKHGTPLPKGHGRLIDADAFLKENEDYTGWILDSSAWGGQNAYKDTLEDIIADAPTIIEADKE